MTVRKICAATYRKNFGREFE